MVVEFDSRPWHFLGYDSRPVATTRAGETTETQFELPLDHRRRLIAKNYGPLRFKYVAGAACDGLPVGCEPTATYVLARSQEQRSAVDGIVIAIPPEPMWWLTVTKIGRHKSGDWLVRFDITDLRQAVWFLAPGNGYTSSRYRAIDDLEVVAPEHLRNRHRAISARDEQLRLERVAANRTERWRRKRQSRRVARALTEAAA